jgi:hypothetical protein
VAYVLHDGCSSGTQEKVVTYVCYIMDVAVRQWDTGQGSVMCVP